MTPSTTTPAAPILPHADPATQCARAAAPIWHQIPAELQARRQWVCWRYDTRNDKPTKVPYNPHTGQPASTTAPRTWSTFEQAKAAYLQRPDFYDGIGYVFSKHDPYCGADFDHCINAAGEISSWAAERERQLQASGAYTETSVSGTGVHAIVLATIGKGIKKPLGEIYDRGRFFTFSGRRRPGSSPIADGQAAIDMLAAELRGLDDKPARDAGAPTEHSPEEWDEARRLQRTHRDLLLKRSLAATAREGTQGFFATRMLWAEFHQRWAFVGVYRADGVFDDSQARAVLASSLRARGFTFAEYVVIMSHHFAAYCLTKWGTKDAWRAELERLWNHAPPAERTPAPMRPAAAAAAPAKPRGRAGNHAHQVEQVYGLLLEHRAGAQALVQTAELASEAGMHRVTLAGILAELRSAGRIATARNGRYGGLIISFPDVAIVAEAAAAQPAPIAETAIVPVAAMEETQVPNSTRCVSSDSAPAGYSLPAPRRLLADAVREAFDLVRVDQETGERRRVTQKRLLATLAELGSWPAAAVERAIELERQHRRIAAILADIQRMSPATLRAQLRLMERLADKSREQGTNLYRYAEWAGREMRAELGRRPVEPGRKPRKNSEALPDPRAAGERYQQDLLDLVDRTRPPRARQSWRPVADVAQAPTATLADSLLARLRQRQAQQAALL